MKEKTLNYIIYLFLAFAFGWLIGRLTEAIALGNITL